MPFAPLMRMARAWLDSSSQPDIASIGALVTAGKDLAHAVPDERRADWDKLLAGLEAGGDKTRARVEGLVRACRLFVRQAARDEKLGPLATVDVLPGLGPTARTALGEHGLRTVADLVWLPPVAWDDLRAPVALADAVAEARAAYERGDVGRPPRVVVRGIVKSGGVVPIRGRRSVRLVLRDVADEKCTLHAFWFFMAHGVLALAKPGQELLLIGRMRVEKGKPPRVAHPEIFADTPEMRVVRPRYARLGPPEAAVRKAVAHAVGKGIHPDPVPEAIAIREAMPDAGGVLREVHAATGELPSGELPSGESRRAFVERLAWAEAFTRVWERLASQDREGKAPSPVLPGRPDLVQALERELGFRLTEGQRAAIATVAKDLADARPMRRLLLGDVGTGKTAVALAAAAQCIAAGHQVAILAPTSVLAEQYLDALAPLERAAGAKVAFVAAGAKGKAKALAALAAGEADVAVGTHALLRDDVAIPKLGLVVVDEQQRLGVAQRLSLVKKGARPHLLTLSATPIPRTLALALRGELATSSLRERPAGRPPVATELAPSSELASVVRRVDEACARGERVFWVVPRIEDDGDDDDDDDPLASATAREAALREALPSRKVVMLHGGMSSEDKRAVMRAFRSGEAQILVGTTVIEVGVDVPEATLMVIEDAERFGLAQLHQLRGRVGRGDRPGACVLVHGEPLEGPAKGRLVAMTELSTGEDIARADLELRGAGDLGGTRQHGAEEELLFLETGAGYAWLDRIEADAKALHDVDPGLAAHPILGSLVSRLGHVLAVREEAG